MKSLLHGEVGTSPVNSTLSSRSMASFLKTQVDVWLIRIGVGAVLLGLALLFKFTLDSQPRPIPADLRIRLVDSSPQADRTNYAMVICSNPGESNATNDVIRLPPAIFPNSYLPCKDYAKAGSSTNELGNVSKYFHTSVEDSELLHAAQDVATQPLPPGKPKVAFLFILRERIPLKQMWERFFAEADEEAYSIYTHMSMNEGKEEFPETSVFHNRAIPSKEVYRFSITLVDVVRRLLAFALLDTARANMWFVLVSDACIPVRSFPYVYNYYMNSTTSFVEAFSVWPKFKRWDTEPLITKEDVRKGELWMSMHRRHAGMVVGDVTFYRKFKSDCAGQGQLESFCVLDEMYSQTFLHIRDPQGIANRSVTYTDWKYPHSGSPRTHTIERMNNTLIEKIQTRTENLDGNYWESSDDVSHTIWRDCVYNGRPHSPCFLFARKFSGNETDVQALLQIPKSVLGY